MAIIKLKSSDGIIIPVDLEAAKQSTTIKTMLKELGKNKKNKEEPLPLPNVSGVILEKVIEWVTHQKDNPPSKDDKKSKQKTDDIGEWDQNFLKLEQPMLFDLILAANYLDIKSLLDVASKAMANLFKGSFEEICKAFNVAEVLAPQEHAQEEDDGPSGPKRPRIDSVEKMDVALASI